MHYGALVIRIVLNCYSNRYTKIKGYFIHDTIAKSTIFLIDLAIVLSIVEPKVSIF